MIQLHYKFISQFWIGTYTKLSPSLPCWYDRYIAYKSVNHIHATHLLTLYSIFVQHSHPLDNTWHNWSKIIGFVSRFWLSPGPSKVIKMVQIGCSQQLTLLWTINSLKANWNRLGIFSFSVRDPIQEKNSFRWFWESLYDKKNCVRSTCICLLRLSNLYLLKIPKNNSYLRLLKCGMGPR